MGNLLKRVRFLRGFTLIELLVVISIIALLSAIGLSVFNNSQKKARDARRRADLKSIQSAAELWYLDCDDYPDDSTEFYTGGLSICGGGAGVYLYMPGNVYPKDPKSGLNYIPVTADNDGYNVCVDLETVGTWLLNQPPVSGNRDYCVSNLQ